MIRLNLLSFHYVCSDQFESFPSGETKVDTAQRSITAAPQRLRDTTQKTQHFHFAGKQPALDSKYEFYKEIAGLACAETE